MRTYLRPLLAIASGPLLLAAAMMSGNVGVAHAQPLPAGTPPAPTGPAPMRPAPHAPPTGTSAPPMQPPPSAGGLSAPPPVAAAKRAPQSETQQTLDESKEKDSGRGTTWFWLEAEGGFQHIGLETFEVDESNLTAGFVSNTASGPYVGAALGVQLLFLRLGPRLRVGFFDNWNMLSIGGELGLRFPLGVLEPYVNLGGGYTALGSYGDGLALLPSSVDISGFNLRVGGGLDFFIGNVLSLGATASWEFMGLTRPGVSLADVDPNAVSSLDDAQQKALAAEGSGYGSAITIGGKLGLNF